jgi:hydroxymethylpyrimidine pyrophosphatase-like HAD family hydrolase
VIRLVVTDHDVVLGRAPSTSSIHIGYLGSIARTGDLAATVASSGVYGFSVTGRDRSELDPLADELRAHGAELFLLSEAKYGGWSLIVAPPVVTKWAGVQAYCDLRGIKPAEVMAVGDGDNDVAMLARAGIAVGVRGGTPAALAAADHLIDEPSARGWAEIVDLVRAAER